MTQVWHKTNLGRQSSLLHLSPALQRAFFMYSCLRFFFFFSCSFVGFKTVIDRHLNWPLLPSREETQTKCSSTYANTRLIFGLLIKLAFPFAWTLRRNANVQTQVRFWSAQNWGQFYTQLASHQPVILTICASQTPVFA